MRYEEVKFWAARGDSPSKNVSKNKNENEIFRLSWSVNVSDGNSGPGIIMFRPIPPLKGPPPVQSTRRLFFIRMEKCRRIISIYKQIITTFISRSRRFDFTFLLFPLQFSSLLVNLYFFTAHCSSTCHRAKL